MSESGVRRDENEEEETKNGVTSKGIELARREREVANVKVWFVVGK